MSMNNCCFLLKISSVYKIRLILIPESRKLFNRNCFHKKEEKKERNFLSEKGETKGQENAESDSLLISLCFIFLCDFTVKSFHFPWKQNILNLDRKHFLAGHHQTNHLFVFNFMTSINSILPSFLLLVNLVSFQLIPHSHSLQVRH